MTRTIPSLEDYATSRAAFLASAERHGATLEHHVHPRPGPDGGELATDTVQAGDLIIAAAIGAALDALMDQFYPYDGTLVTEEDARASLAADLIKLFDGDTSNDPTYLMTDPTLVGGFLYAGDPDALPDPIPPAPLYNILLAAGFDVAALMGGS